MGCRSDFDELRDGLSYGLGLPGSPLSLWGPASARADGQLASRTRAVRSKTAIGSGGRGYGLALWLTGRQLPPGGQVRLRFALVLSIRTSSVAAAALACSPAPEASRICSMRSRTRTAGDASKALSLHGGSLQFDVERSE